MKMWTKLRELLNNDRIECLDYDLHRLVLSKGQAAANLTEVLQQVFL